MNHPDFTALRRLVDEAITFHDIPRARALAREGRQKAEDEDCPSEAAYFQAQEKIIEGDFVRAVPYLQQALRLNPSDGAAYNDLALCRVEEGCLEGVEELFDRGIAVESDYATIHHNKGWFLNKLGRHREALACFEKALFLDPGRAVTYENMADAYENAGEIGPALRAYKKALELVRSSGPIRDQIRGEIERLEGRRD